MKGMKDMKAKGFLRFLFHVFHPLHVFMSEFFGTTLFPARAWLKAGDGNGVVSTIAFPNGVWERGEEFRHESMKGMKDMKAKGFLRFLFHVFHPLHVFMSEFFGTTLFPARVLG